MAFFATASAKGVEEEDERRAKRLRKQLRKAGKLVTAPKLDRWSKEFALLRRGTTDDIDRVLEWYVKNIGKPFVPRAYSAKAFRSKFVAIGEAMGRDASTVELSADEQKMFERLTATSDWPNEDQLRKAISDSMLWLDDIREVMHAEIGDDGEWAMVAVYLRRTACTRTAVEAYLANLYRWIKAGQIKRVPACDYDNGKWMDHIAVAAKEFGRSRRDFDRMMKEFRGR